VFLILLVEESQPEFHRDRDDRGKCFRSSISVIALVFFMLATATLQILSIVISISETPQSVYGLTQATVTENNIVLDSQSSDNNLKPMTSNLIRMAATSISDNGNNNTPFLLPSPSSSQSSSDNSTSSPAAGLASTTSPSNNVVKSHPLSQGHSISQTNIVSSSDNHVDNQHNIHTHASTVDPIHRVSSQSKKQFTGGQIPFP
jgi:hypothetical protein